MRPASLPKLNRPAAGVKGTADASAPLDPVRCGRFRHLPAMHGFQTALPSYTEFLILPRETLLFQGHAARIANELDKAAHTSPSQADALRREAAYFRHNHLRMNYLEMREGEWLIGSGMVESGAKQFKSRFCGPGMPWSRAGAQHLLPIRAAVLSRRFNDLWAAAQNLPPA